MRLGTILKLAGIATLLLIVALIQVVKSIDVNAYRDVLDQAARTATGRDLIIRGKLSLKMSLSPALVADDVVFTNASWGTRPDMITVDRIEAKIALLPLLTREVRVKHLHLVGPDILLERNAAGAVNWAFTQPAPGQVPNLNGAGPLTTLKIGQLRIDNGQIIYRDGQSGRQETVRLDRFVIEGDGAAVPLGITAGGSWNGRHFDVSGVLGSVRDLMAGGKPYPVKLKGVLPGLVATANGTVTPSKGGVPTLALAVTAEATEIADAAKLVGSVLPPLGAARLAVTVGGPALTPSLSDIELALGRRDAVAVNVKGSVKNPVKLSGVDLLLTAEGENLAGFNKPLDAALPNLSPIKFVTHLTDVEGGWRAGDLKAVFGHSDAVGDATLILPGRRAQGDAVRNDRAGGGRPMVEIHLASTAIDLGEQAVRHPEPAKPQVGGSYVFADDELPIQLLSSLDGKLTWKIDKLTRAGVAAGDVNLSALLQEGRLTATPKIGTIAGGKLSGTLIVDAAAKPTSVALKVDADKVAMGDLLKGFDITPAVHGAPTDLRLNLTGTGNSVRSIMARLNGETMVAVGKGTIDGAYADVLAVDVLQQLAPWSEQKNTEMQCLVSRFSVADGMARSEALLFDTTSMTVGGQGSINLANEVIDLTLAPKPKEASLLSLAIPLDVGGTLARPSVTPDKGAIVKGAASAVGAVALGPLGALVPLVSTGSGDSNPCLAAISQAKKPLPARKPSKGAGGVGSILHGIFGN